MTAKKFSYGPLGFHVNHGGGRDAPLLGRLQALSNARPRRTSSFLCPPTGLSGKSAILRPAKGHRLIKRMTEPRRNWAGNYCYQARAVHRPVSIDEVRDLVRSHSRLKVLGTRHSFNGIADTTADHLSLERLNRIVSLDRENRTVTIEGGVRYGDLGPYLHREGWALHNLASLPHTSVAGAIATATHGSGDQLGNLATAVHSFEMVTADGNIATLTRRRDGDEFQGSVVALGGLGVVTTLTLDIEPAYDVRQLVFEGLSFAEFESHFDAITSSATSVSFFTDWRDDRFHQVWQKQRVAKGAPNVEAPPDFFGARLAANDVHPISAHPVEHCTSQMGVSGPWHERLPHFRLEFTPSSGAELQSEYLVPRRHACEALGAVARMRASIEPHILVTEVRTMAADQFWLSPNYLQPSVAIHFTWKPDWPTVKELLPVIEARLEPFGARPHWGKLCTMTPERVQSLYPRLADFQRLLQSRDPEGKFRNAFLDAYVAGIAARQPLQNL